MQAAMQLNNYSLSLTANMNSHCRGSAMPHPSQWPSQPTRAAGFPGGSNPSGQMSNTLSGFSKTSFSVSSQTTANGRSSTFCVQQTVSNRGQAMNPQPQPHCQGRNDNFAGRGSSTRDNHCDDRSRSTERTPPRNDCGCKDSGRSDQAQWNSTGVTDNKATINLGDYKLDFNKSDSSMTVTNAKTGDTTKVWGDPHLTQHANGSNSSTAMFNGNMTFELPDSTKITVGTQPGANNKSVSYADQVTITHGNQAYQVTGLSQEDKAGLSVQKSNNGRALDAATPDGYTVEAARNGSGWIDPKTGKEPTASDIANANK